MFISAIAPPSYKRTRCDSAAIPSVGGDAHIAPSFNAMITLRFCINIIDVHLCNCSSFIQKDNGAMWASPPTDHTLQIGILRKSMCEKSICKPPFIQYDKISQPKAFPLRGRCRRRRRMRCSCRKPRYIFSASQHLNLRWRATFPSKGRL